MHLFDGAIILDVACYDAHSASKGYGYANHCLVIALVAIEDFHIGA